MRLSSLVSSSSSPQLPDTPEPADVVVPLLAASSSDNSNEKTESQQPEEELTFEEAVTVYGKSVNEFCDTVCCLCDYCDDVCCCRK